ncbi:vWA domain-containing protein [Microtetraspora malaysiensis]|uniref:vWA domain-containing protein n=1 Tax=Microtetraspora malaysiensis TaxID=161358 RepID=UPI003D90C78F
MSRREKKADPWRDAVHKGWDLMAAHPLFGTLRGYLYEARDGELPKDAWAYITAGGNVHHHPKRRADPAEWAWVFAHCLLHAGFGHLDPRSAAAEDLGPDEAARWNGPRRAPSAAYRAACCLAVDRFLQTLKIGRPPEPLPHPLPEEDERTLAARWRVTGVPADCRTTGFPDFFAGSEELAARLDFPRSFAIGVSAAATRAIEVAGGARSSLADVVKKPWDVALGWFVSSYPLLGALATGMTIVADADLARAWDVSIAAVNAQAAEIYVNPLVTMTTHEWRFVLAHEMLHAALRHGDRVGWRDPYLWNVACDYVINGWLVEMGVGTMPEGLLYDSSLKGLSGEAVYDRIVGDLRRMRKLATLRGRGIGDVLGEPLPRPGAPGRYVDLDDYYRNALASGLVYHRGSGRGDVPAGLEEEIRALDQPPLPWDAGLARWFEEHLPAVERRRSYGRASRRQSATPDIPRPGWTRPDEVVRRATFGVVLDTSGSMDTKLLGKALGAIASYAVARDVPRARVVFCDAAAYDAGYLAVEDIAAKVRVRGRGGTVLQPGIDLLERADDFPADGPILVITDGACDVVRIRREHAFLIPAGASLPFRPRGPVFRMT